MDFSLTPAQEAWRVTCHEFARDVVRPLAGEADAGGALPSSILAEARSRGLYDAQLLATVGADADGLFPAIYMEELSWGCAGIALALGAATGAVGALVSGGTPAQVEHWVPRCYEVDGRPRLAAWAQTEPDAGSDASSVALSARVAGSSWILNGVKSLVSNGGCAAVTIVVASVDPSLGTRGQALFVVPEGTPGLSVARVEAKMGLRAGRLAELRFDECQLGEELLLGGGERLRERLRRASEAGRVSPPRAGGGSAEFGRALMGAAALGVARAALEEAIVGLRCSGAITHQHVQHALADAATELDAARLLVWRAVWMARNGIALTRAEGSMAKLAASDAAVRIASEMVTQIGWDATTGGALLGKLFRDAKAFQLMEGTNEIQRSAVGRAVAA